MARSLHPLFQAIATAPGEKALRDRFMDGVSDYFGVQRWGIYLLTMRTVSLVLMSLEFLTLL
jgi:hypothetical protein